MSHKLIASDRVEGTAVYDRSGKNIGTIERVMIDKNSGKDAQDRDGQEIGNLDAGDLLSGDAEPESQHADDGE